MQAAILIYLASATPKRSMSALAAGLGEECQRAGKGQGRGTSSNVRNGIFAALSKHAQLGEWCRFAPQGTTRFQDQGTMGGPPTAGRMTDERPLVDLPARSGMRGRIRPRTATLGLLQSGAAHPPRSFSTGAALKNRPSRTGIARQNVTHHRLGVGASRCNHRRNARDD